jgi:succinate dehydrogenase / fumarate reductase, membrane anchor subunit
VSLGTATRLAYQRRMARPAGSDFELWSWYFFRVSGVLVLFLAFGHLAMVHLINNVDTIDYHFVAARWQTIGWRVYDWLLLMLAVTHGQNGLRLLIDDYVPTRGWRALLHTANWVLLGFFLALGTLAITSFPFMPGTGGR